MKKYIGLNGILLLISSVISMNTPYAEDNSSNLMSNSGFEESERGWSIWHRMEDSRLVEVEQVDTPVSEGNAAIHIKSPPGVAVNLFPNEDIVCQGGETFTLSAFARTSDALGTSLAIWVKDAAGSNIDVTLGKVAVPPNVQSYTRFSTSVTLPDNTASIKPILITEGGETYWDAVQLERGNETTAYCSGVGRVERIRTVRPDAHRYARTIITMARWCEALDRLERLNLYLKDAQIESTNLQQDLDTLRALRTSLEHQLQANEPAPAFNTFDYDTITSQLAGAESTTARLCEQAASGLASHNPLFKPVPLPARGPVLTSVHKQDVQERFLVFPLLLSTTPNRMLRFYDGEGDWELLRIFGFEAVCTYAGNFMYQRNAQATSLDEVVDTCLNQLDAIIERNAREGFKTSIWIEPEDIAWALEPEYGEEVHGHAKDGTFFRQSRIHSSVNIWHEGLLAGLKRFAEAMGTRYRDNDNVLCYEIFEEPALVLSDPHPAPGSTLTHLPAGYSVAARNAFRSYLAAQYGDIERLNTAWGSRYSHFEEVEPPQILSGPTRAPAAVYDFGRFRVKSHAQYFAAIVEALKTADPNHAVVPQFVPMAGALRRSGNDAFLMADAGWDFYATHDWPGQGPAYESAFTYSVAQYANKPIWNEEYIWSNWVDRDEGEVALWAGARSGIWRQFAWGKRALELFSWEHGWNSEFEGDWNNEILNAATDLQTPRYAAGVFPEMADKLDRLAPLLYPTTIVNDGLGQLVPTTSLLAAQEEYTTGWWARQSAETLLADHWAPAFLSEAMVLDGTADLDNFKVLVVPYAPMAPAAVVDRLLTWATQGGTLIVLGGFGTLDQHGQPLGRWAALIQQSTSRHLHNVKEVTHGNGIVVEIPTQTFNREPAQLTRYVERACPARAVYSPSRDIELVLREAESGTRYLIATSLDVKRSAQTEVILRGRWDNVVDLTIDGGVPVPTTYEGDTTRFTIRTGPGEGVALQLNAQ